MTGANSGVGRSATEMLLEAGAHVTMVCRSRGRGERALAELRQTAADRSRVELELADLSRQEDVREVATRLDARLPTIDILVNNAGVTRPRCVLSPEGFELTSPPTTSGTSCSPASCASDLRPGGDASST